MRHVQAAVLHMVVGLTAANDNTAVNHSGGGSIDWWAGAIEEDAIRSLPLDGDGGLWSSSFVPPPPRPEYLEDSVSSDGLTTCDLCTWAWRDRGALFPVDAATEGANELGWVFTLAIVSLLSAAIGAVVMITLLQCRNRIKNLGSTCLCSLCITRSPDRATSTTPATRQGHGDKDMTETYPYTPPNVGVWSWLLARRVSRPIQLSTAPTVPAENHYTLDETYTSVEEALYAELDRESNPAYQNTAYNEEDVDAPVSSAPSSAYYSDLSCADRTYEAVGAGGGGWDANDIALRRHQRLSAITETVTVPSDYV